MHMPPNALSRKRCVHRGARGHRVINVNGNPSYPKVMAELKQHGELGRRCRPVRYLNNIVEQESPGDQAPRESQPGLPITAGGAANDSGDRNDKYDPQRADSMGTEKRYCWASCVSLPACSASPAPHIRESRHLLAP
jgi:hypothetical protein